MQTNIATCFSLSLIVVTTVYGFVPSTSTSLFDSSTSRPGRLPSSSIYKNSQHLKSRPLSTLFATTSEDNHAMMPKDTKSNDHQRTKKLLLVGGGHAHIQVIKSLNSHTRPSNLQITLVDIQSEASYSGMVPGCVAKLYDLEQVQIDLGAIAKWAGIDYIRGKMVGVDIVGDKDGNVKDQAIVEVDKSETPDREDSFQMLKIPYDVMSLDIGSTTRDFRSVPGALEYAISTRPISELVKKIDKEESLLRKNIENDSISGPIGIVVVGGGAAGIELSLAMRARWGTISDNRGKMSVTLLDSNDRLVPSESLPCRKAMESIMKKYDIEVKHNVVVTEVTSTHIRVVNADKEKNAGDDECYMIPYTHCIWATGAESHPLSRNLHRQCGLSITDRGWIEVNQHLQSISHNNIFAAGDCCEIVFPRGSGDETKKSPPKAGVYAVRSGPILIENLTRQLGLGMNNTLVTYNPQEDFLKLLMCGDGTALGFRFGIPLYGKWVWKLKDHIDRKFMDLFDVKKLPVLRNNDGKNDGNDCNSKPYDTSQYDEVVEKPPRLDAKHAGKLLLRTDDDVDFQSAWNVLREMMIDERYKSDVLEIIESFS